MMAWDCKVAGGSSFCVSLQLTESLHSAARLYRNATSFPLLLSRFLCVFFFNHFAFFHFASLSEAAWRWCDVLLLARSQHNHKFMGRVDPRRKYQRTGDGRWSMQDDERRPPSPLCGMLTWCSNSFLSPPPPPTRYPAIGGTSRSSEDL